MTPAADLAKLKQEARAMDPHRPKPGHTPPYEGLKELAGLQVIKPGIELVKKSEQFRSKPYLDYTGHATVGFGHRILPHEDLTREIDEPEGYRLLVADIKKASDIVKRAVKVPLTPGQHAALTSWVFNLGEGRLAKSTMLKRLNEGKYDEAKRQLQLWDHAGKKKLKKLTERRKAEASLWDLPALKDPEFQASVGSRG